MSYDVHINRQEISALFDLKGDPSVLAVWAGNGVPPLPEGHNRLVTVDGKHVFHIGRNHWLLRTRIDREEACLAALRPSEAPPEISIVRVSDTLTFFDITGPDAGEIMSIACPLDLHHTVFGDLDVAFTEVFGLKALLLRTIGGFEFAVEQSFGDMIADYLARATS